jgi:hypothetical protein
MTEKRAWLYDILFVGVLLIAAVLRFGGVGWGEGYHQHPDELFLMRVKILPFQWIPVLKNKSAG